MNKKIQQKRSRKLINLFILSLYVLVFTISIENFGISVNAALTPIILENKHHLGYINTNILFTAPHSKTVYREGPDYVINKPGEDPYYKPLVSHTREKYASWLALELAFKVNSTFRSPHSFCTWAKWKGTVNKQEKDPNYLLESMFPNSQFHLALHAFARNNLHNKYLFHVDFHGKANRPTCQVDIGIRSMRKHWGDSDPFLSRLENEIPNMNSIFQNSINSSHCEFTTDGTFHGYWWKYSWREDRHSMTEQAIEMGIPSFQLQIPYVVRRQLFKSPAFLQKFADALTNVYNNVIIPYYDANENHSLTFNQVYANRFDETINSAQEAKQALNELKSLES